MPAPAIDYPRGVRLDLWGPTITAGGKFYVFKGITKAIPPQWKDVNKLMKELRHLEKIEWAYSLPHEREALFHKKLAVLTKNLPPDWTMIIGTTISGIIIITYVTSRIRSKL